MFEAGSPQTIDNWANLGGKMDSECLQTKPKYNIRKSLAWDSAFFTSPGMLIIMGEKKKRILFHNYENFPVH